MVAAVQICRCVCVSVGCGAVRYFGQLLDSRLAQGSVELRNMEWSAVFDDALVVLFVQDSVFATTVGLAYQPYAKILSVVCTLFVVCRSEEHMSELQSLMRISYAVFCLKKNTD